MTVTEFLRSTGFKPYGSVANSWDSINEAGSVLMQLWQAPGQRIREHALPSAYLRVRCFDAESHAIKGDTQRVGYAGRKRSIETLEAGGRGYAVLSAPPTGLRGPSVWAKHADLSRVYPILKVERSETSDDVFVILSTPIAAHAMK